MKARVAGDIIYVTPLGLGFVWAGFTHSLRCGLLVWSPAARVSNSASRIRQPKPMFPKIKALISQTNALFPNERKNGNTCQRPRFAVGSIEPNDLTSAIKGQSAGGIRWK
jgi:hypothetical protein